MLWNVRTCLTLFDFEAFGIYEIIGFTKLLMGKFKKIKYETKIVIPYLKETRQNPKFSTLAV